MHQSSDLNKVSEHISNWWISTTRRRDSQIATLEHPPPLHSSHAERCCCMLQCDHFVGFRKPLRMTRHCTGRSLQSVCPKRHADDQPDSKSCHPCTSRGLPIVTVKVSVVADDTCPCSDLTKLRCSSGCFSSGQEYFRDTQESYYFRMQSMVATDFEMKQTDARSFGGPD